MCVCGLETSTVRRPRAEVGLLRHRKRKIPSLVVRFRLPCTPWSRVLLEKLTDSQLVKRFPVFYGTRRFITAFTRARHLSLS